MAQFEHWLQSPVGFLHIRTSSDYLEEIRFSEDAPLAETPLPQEGIMPEVIKQLQEYFAGARRSFALPLNQKGSEFQQRVWRQLAQIPYGKTCSYLELALQLGDKKAVRAVGLANGKNPIPIVLPCHRVIGSDGSLTGYAGGLERKRWLLEHEGVLQQLSLF